MFTKEELSNAIKAKLTVNGKSLSMSQRTMDEMVNNHFSFVTEETDLNEFVKKVLPVYEGIEGQLRHDKSDFIKQWEKEHPTNTPPKGEPEPKNQDEVTKSLLARIEKMEKEAEEAKLVKTISGLKADIANKAKEKGVSNKEWMDSYLEGLAVNAESDVEQMAESALRLFNMTNSQINPNATPSQAGGGTQGKDEGDFADIVSMRK